MQRRNDGDDDDANILLKVSSQSNSDPCLSISFFLSFIHSFTHSLFRSIVTPLSTTGDGTVISVVTIRRFASTCFGGLGCVRVVVPDPF